MPEQSDIQETLKICNLLEKALILVGVSSRLSVEDICNLKIKDFKAGQDPETNITILLNQDDDFEEKYQWHLQILKNDHEYKKTCQECEKSITSDVFMVSEFHDELKECEYNRYMEKSRHIRTLDRLLDEI